MERMRPFAGPFARRISKASWRSSGFPTRVPSSRNQRLQDRVGTLWEMRLTRGWRTREKSRAARGSPWWRPSWLEREVLPKRR